MRSGVATRRELLLGSLAGWFASGSQARGQTGAQERRVPNPHPEGSRISVTGEAGEGLAHFDEVMFGLFRRHGIPGGSLCLAKDGRLVLAKGYGWAQLEPRQPVRPGMMFGVASVSKAITAVAVLKLVQDGRLRLEDRALGILGDLRPLPGARADPRVHDITVRHLLQHSSGYERSAHVAEAARALGVDESEVTPDQCIRFRLGKPLQFAPGTKTSYSNYAYLVLGQVIERVSGIPYPRLIHQMVFRPMGIHRAALGTREPHYPAGWVHRYDGELHHLPPLPPRAVGAAGGWVTSGVELIRFLSALDGTRRPPFLEPAMMRQMLAPPPPPVEPRKNGSHFGLGWDTVRTTPKGPSYAKNGRLEGIRSFIGHMPGNVDWAVLFNGGHDPENGPDEDADAGDKITRAIRSTNNWPDGDLFERFS